jgi:predicted nucleic acid-binding protein
VSFLIDTNVISEATKKKPNREVVTWLYDNEPRLYISAITVGELRRGIDRLPPGKRRRELTDWLSGVCNAMKGRVLSFNVSVAHVWGQLKAKWDREGLVVPSIDSQIAATAVRYDLTLVSGDESAFRNAGVPLLNPFIG